MLEKSYPLKQQWSLVNLTLLHRTKQQTWKNEKGMTFIRNGKLKSFFFKGKIKKKNKGFFCNLWGYNLNFSI